MKDSQGQAQAQNPHSSDHDFLEGIDEQFQRLMKLAANRKNGRSSRSHDPLTSEILDRLQNLTTAQKEEVLAFVRALKHQAE